MEAVMSMAVSVFLFSPSPLVSASIILTATLIMSSWMFAKGVTPLFSYVMFLVFLGGVMVLFTYMCSLAPNEKFINSKMVWGTSFLLAFMATVTMLSSEMKFMWKKESLKAAMKMASSNMELSYMYLFAYLLITLFVCVSISNKKKGAVRMGAN